MFLKGNSEVVHRTLSLICWIYLSIYLNEAKFCQQVGNKLDTRILGLIQVHVDISQHDGVLTPEARQGLLYIGEVGHRGWRELCSNDQGPVRASDVLSAYHVRPVEAHQLKAPSSWTVL